MKHTSRHMPHNTVRVGRGRFDLLYARQNQKRTGIELQIYASDAENNLVWAGVEWHADVSQRTANIVQRLWARWRKEYDALPENARHDYPAKHCKVVAYVTLFPIDTPAVAQTFIVPTR